MDERDEAVAWVRERFNDPTHYLDADVLDHIARDPGFAVAIKEMITQPKTGLQHRMDIGPPADPELGTPAALAHLNERLRLAGLHAVPFEGEWAAGPVGSKPLWTVRVPQSHVRFVGFVLSGRYRHSSGPDGEAMADDVVALRADQLAALRRCFYEAQTSLRAAQARLHGEEIPDAGEHSPNMLHYLMDRTVEHIGRDLTGLEFMDRIVAHEQSRRQTTG